MFEDIPINSATRDELIEAMEDFNKTIIPKMMSTKGTKFLRTKYENLDEPAYLKKLLDSREKTSLMIKKLENKQTFSKEFIAKLKERFEKLFIDINELVGLYDDKEFCEEQKKHFDRLKSIYKQMYPESTFNFDALLQGKNPYH